MKYSIHPIYAVVYNNTNNIKMMLCKNGCVTTPEQRKEAELLVKLLNFYSEIDFDLLNSQINILSSISENNVTLIGDIEACDGIINMLSSLISIKEDLTELKNVKLKDEVEKSLINLYTKKIGIDIPNNHEDITQYVFEYIMDVVGNDYSDQDIGIAFRMWIENNNC
jgi:hypothetical protein